MKSIYRLFIAPAICLAVQSCSLMGSIDDIKPEHVVDDQTVIVDAETAQISLNGVYASVRSFEVCVFRACMSVWANTYANANVAGANQFRGDNRNRSSITVDNTGVENIYRGSYLVINNVNSFIANLTASNPSDLSETRRNEMLGEARCMRALFNLHLLRLFGEYYDENSPYGIVIYDTPVRDNTPKPRSSVADCYKFIKEDLEFAYLNAPDYQYEHCLFSKLVAKALLSRLYISRCDYANAALCAGEVIDEAMMYGYGLEPDFTSCFDTQVNSSEMLYAPYVNSATGENVFSCWQSTTPGDLLSTLGTTMGSDGGYDPRYEATYVDISNVNQTAKYPLFENGYQDVNSYYFMRLPEVYYIKAEAEARLGDYNAAREAMRPLNDRSGYDADYVDNIADADMVGMILKNKLMEMSVECGEEWFDLVRYHRQGGFESWSEIEKAHLPAFNQIILPIPRTAMAGNNLLIQNPDYQTL